MINLFIGFGFITIYIIFVQMVGDDGAAQVSTFLLHRLLHAEDFFGLNSMLHADAVDVPDPVEYGIGGSEWQRIFVEPFQIGVDVAVVEDWVALLPLAGVACVVDHQRAVIHWRCLHR